DEANALLRRYFAGESVCVRLYRRRDGTVVTRDCQESLRIARLDGSLRLLKRFRLIGLLVTGFALVVKLLTSTHSAVGICVLPLGDAAKQFLMQPQGGNPPDAPENDLPCG